MGQRILAGITLFLGEQKGRSVVTENPKQEITENFRRIQRGGGGPLKFVWKMKTWGGVEVEGSRKSAKDRSLKPPGNVISETLNFKISLDALALKDLCLWREFQSHLLFVIGLLLQNFLTALIVCYYMELNLREISRRPRHLEC